MELLNTLGRFHMVFLHLPIGIVVLAFLLEFIEFKVYNKQYERLRVWTLFWAFIGSLLATILGLIYEREGGFQVDQLWLHKILGIVTTVMVLITWLLRYRYYLTEKEKFKTFSRVCLLISLLTLTIGSHYGGAMNHGTDFLTEPLFPNETKPKVENVAAVEENQVELVDFTSQIQPIFEVNCYGCHGPKKQKSDYRLDEKGYAFTSGDSEETPIVPRDPEASNLILGLLLPKDDDLAMPPKKKDPLTDTEIQLIVEWLKQGAIWP